MNKAILAIAFFSLFMTSCGGSQSEQTTAGDSTSVAADSVCCDSTKCDTTCVDTLAK
jgi:hypothetical protein